MNSRTAELGQGLWVAARGVALFTDAYCNFNAQDLALTASRDAGWATGPLCPQVQLLGEKTAMAPIWNGQRADLASTG